LKQLSTVDRWTFAYTILATLALAAHWPVRAPGAFLLPIAHLLLFALVFIAPRARRSGGVGLFLGEWYPIILLTAFYTEVGILNLAAGRSHDLLVQRWELQLFGCQPSYDWIRAQPWPWLSTLLHLAYLSYYFIVAGSTLGLWLSARRAAAVRTILMIAVTFYICYSTFLLFPVAGPRYLLPLATNAATATPVAVFTQRWLNGGAAWGTAFPSSHVAAALVAAGMAFKGWRRLGWLLYPAAALLTLGTVYGQLHYATDALAGLMLAVLVLGLESRVGRLFARQAVAS